MVGELEDRVRERAHDIWEREGRPSGKAEEHWSKAMAEITKGTPVAASSKAPAAASEAPAEAKPAPRKNAAASIAAPKRKTAAKPAAKD